MASKEEVVFAFRYLLGREPENENIISHYIDEVSDWRKLREVLVHSHEYKTSEESALDLRSPRTLLDSPPMIVEVEAAPEKLEELFAVTSAQWRGLGETEPFWSVLTEESYFQENFQMNRSEFYASGESDVRMFDAWLVRSGIDAGRFSSCLELGCGVGRVTARLARRFTSVIAVDISEAHLKLAADYFQAEGMNNIQCCQLKNVRDVDALGTFDVLFSRLVLQHNPPPVMAHLLDVLLSKLNAGGIAYIQIPTYKADYRFSVDEYLADPDQTAMEMHCFPQNSLMKLIEDKQCRILEIREDDSIGQTHSSVSNMLLIQKAD